MAVLRDAGVPAEQIVVLRSAQLIITNCSAVIVQKMA